MVAERRAVLFLRFVRGLIGFLIARRRLRRIARIRTARQLLFQSLILGFQAGDTLAQGFEFRQQHFEQRAQLFHGQQINLFGFQSHCNDKLTEIQNYATP
ncbi:MAG: hypothetical protein AB7I31_29565 [Blastocatellales bacterium]